MSSSGRSRAAALLLTIAVVLLLHALVLQGPMRDATPRRNSVTAVQVRSVAPQPVVPVAELATVPAAPPQTPPAPQARPIAPAKPRPADRRATAPAGARSAPMAASPALPLHYPALPPPSAALHYELRRGTSSGRAELHWQRDSDRYSARLEGELAGQPLLQWSSRGGFDAAGVAPQRFVAQGRRRSAQAVNFQRDAGKITFSGPTVEHPLAAGAQDRLSWMVQLAAIVQARAPAAGERIAMQVAGPRGDAESWQFDVLGDSVLETDAGPVQALRLLRAPLRHYDMRVEVWLDPGRHYWPVRVLLGTQDDGREPLEWLLRH